MKKITIFFALIFSVGVFSQNTFNVKVDNINEGDSIRVIIQKSSDILLKDWAHYNGGDTSTVSFNLSEGEWAVSLDATGYTYPSQQVVNIPNDISVTFALTGLTNADYDYTWEDDGSAAGHATQRYVNGPAKIVVLNDSIVVPDDFSAVKLRTEYGVVLSDSIQPWSSEDSYRLYKMFSNLPYDKYGEGSGLDYETGENIRGVFMLTDLEQDNDLSINNATSVPYATVSQSAFTYAEPQIVTIDGIRGKFFSKRLYHAVVNFITDFANNEEVLSWLAKERFGLEFMIDNQQTEDIMGEDSSNFQEFFNSEKLEILAMFEELPEGFHKQNGLKYLVRRINGQDDPVMPPAAAIAFSDRHVIEFMSKAFNGGSINDSRRIILHEKAHFLWAYTFDQQLKDDWAELGGWFLDPTGASGWSTTNTTESVSAYAHLKNPNEDLSESIAFYLTNPDALLSVSVRKYEFVRDRVMHGTRYIAQIREDLTFTVYNLFPDYTYPGKVTKVEVNVVGGSEEDKVVTIRASLHSDAKDPNIDGASTADIRFASSIGTIHDIRLSPENGQAQDSVLIGTTTFNKLQKSGFWTLAYFNVTDLVGNTRYENTSTVGMKLYIENPLEDILPPVYNYDFKYEIVEDKFTTGQNAGVLDVNGENMRAIKISTSHYDASPVQRLDVNVVPPNDNKEEVYERGTLGYPIVDKERDMDNVSNSDKHFEIYFLLYEYLQSGWYFTSSTGISDIAGNRSTVYHVKDTADFIISEKNKFKIFKEVRDSIYIETLYPDSLKPEIDINNITISAEPTNPQAPNGETRVNISILARDLSEFSGHESGISGVSFTLRDPLGGIHGYQSGNGTMNDPSSLDGSQDPENNNNWEIYTFDLLLPQGSPPGQWGMASARATDKSGNWEQYSFVEYVRFDIIESDIELTKPLEVEITDKVVNTYNVNSITASMSCEPCKDMNYVYTIYSLMGGNVVRGEGIFENDSISVSSINTTGVLEGIIKLTIQVTDTEDKLVATKTAEYTKDTVLPNAYYSQSNLENDGTSSLDDFVIAVVIESVDVGGTYDLNIESTQSGKSTNIMSLDFQGGLNTETTSLANLDLSTLGDGDYKFELMVTDPNGNRGEPEILYYKKEGNLITLIGSTYTINNAPIAVDDATTVNEDADLTSIDVITNDTDIEEDALTITAVTYTGTGIVAINNNKIEYTPAVDFNGTETIIYTISDGVLTDSSGTLTLTVTAVNDAPVAVNDATTLDEDADLTSVDVITNDTDIEEDALTITAVTYTGTGIVAINNNKIEYTPDTDFNGTETIIYTVSDGVLTDSSGTLTLTVTAVNDAPVAVDDVISLEKGDSNTVILTATDIDNDDLTYSIVDQPTHGTVTLDGNQATYTTTNATYTGADGFTFTASDNNLISNLATITIDVTLDVVSYSLESIKSYPNPFNEFYIIESILPLKLEVYDINGKIVLKRNLESGQNKINETNLSKGVYIFKFKYKNRTRSKVLIKE